jgi:very-short-patch-repair endonuclease
LSFRSKTEREIAKALDRANVVFAPNAKVRLGVTADHRQTLEPDFLVCCDGKLGLLEVDGSEWHPPQRSAEEHERDRRFHEHGIRVVQRFDARRWYEMPDEVVAEFLRLLRLNG